MKYKIFTNSKKNKRAIDKRSVGVSLKFKLLFWALNTFFREWTIVKDLMVLDDEIVTKNLGPTFGSNVILKSKTITIAGPKQFQERLNKFLGGGEKIENKI